MSIENFVMEWLPVIFLKSRSLAWLRGDLGAVWMLPARQLQRQAVPPGVGFRSPGAEIDCLAGKLRPGRHPNEPSVRACMAAHKFLLFVFYCGCASFSFLISESEWI